MADAYLHPLLLQFDENNIPRLNVKLVKYFQSKKCSGGGDCEVEHQSGSRKAVLRFQSQEVQRNVLARETHLINLGKGTSLTVRVCLLPDDKTAQEVPSDDLSKKLESSCDEVTPAAGLQPEAEEPLSTSAVIGNIPEGLTQEFMGMLVENVLKNPDSPSDATHFTLEAIPDMSFIVVTFQKEKENADFVKRCPQNRMFTNKHLSVRALEVTKQVAVEDVQHLSQDLLSLYFDNKGWEVENVELYEEEHATIITFKDSIAVQNVLKKQHHFGGKEIRVFPFYKSFGKCLYGKDKPPLKLPPAVSETVDVAVLKYLKDHPLAAEAVRNELAKHFCKVTLDQSDVCLTPVPLLLQQKGAKVLVSEWRASVKSAFARAVSKYTSAKFQPDSAVWKECEEKMKHELQDKKNVALVADEASGLLAVVGLQDDVNSLVQSLCEVVNKIDQKLQRQKCSISKVIKVSSSIFRLLCHDGLQENLLCNYPELKMSFSKESSDLTIIGLSKEIAEANRYICDAIRKLMLSNLEMDEHVLRLLKLDEQEELTDVLLASHGINAAFKMDAQRVQLTAFSDKHLNEAKEHLQRLLTSQVIDVEDGNILETPEWLHLVGQVEEENSGSCRRLLIQTISQQVVVCGLKEVVDKVCDELDDFLMENTQVEETMVVQPNAIVEYIEKLYAARWGELNYKVVVSFKEEEICLSGCRAHVTQCKTLVDNWSRSVVFESFKVSKPGLRKFFKDKESMYVSSLLNETGCLVRLVEETSGEAAHAASNLRYSAQTLDGVRIGVSKADMCSYLVDAVVNPSSPDLKHSSDLAGALSKAAGPQLQIECNKIISLRGQIQSGDCVVTEAGGRLRCKKVIHAVGPMYNLATPKKDTAQLKKVVKGSLELAEKSGCVSVALPAISKNQGFPLDVCMATIVNAIKEHCEEGFGENTLKEIHLVDNDDVVVQVMGKALECTFGTKVDHSQTLKTKVAKDRTPLKLLRIPGPKSKTRKPDQSCLGQVKTKEGLEILLTQGNIEDATTEGVVNILSMDLALNKGAVSNAILRVAGPHLQLLVNEHKESAAEGEIIVTGGCRLKSKRIFHAVAPHWDKGEGAAEETLRDIFKDCLEMVEEDRLTSISFPAIGTGHLGFPRDRVASMLFQEISAFSSRVQPTALRKVGIILFPGDPTTIQVFSDEFTKRFPNASGRAAASVTPPRPAPFSKVVSSSGMYETKMGNVAVQLVTGDITKETTDVIVNSSNETFTLKSGVSKAILAAAGAAVEAECQALGAQTNLGMVMTQPGNLKCKKILHLVGQTQPGRIKQVVENALQMCMQNSYTSVSFPAIGTGQGNAQARQVADAMFGALIDVLSQSPSGPLQTFRIVVFQPPMVTEFYSSMQQREKKEEESPKPEEKETGWLSEGFHKIRSYFTSQSAVKPHEVGDFLIKALDPVDPDCFHICGDSQFKVDLAKRWISDLIDKDQRTKRISDMAVLKFSDADHKRIVDIQESLGVGITTECKDGRAWMTIEGFGNVLEAYSAIHEMLGKVRDEEELKKMMELAETVADWQYQEDLGFRSFDSEANLQLEQALDQNKQSVIVTVQGRRYTVAMPKGPATDGQGGTLQIKRVDRLKVEELPLHWDHMPDNTLCHTVLLTAGTPEYTEVLNLFQATCKQTVVKMERIQNPVLWRSLHIKKRAMEQRNAHQNNERRLFHGTCHTTLPIINHHGFNRSFAGMNAACYGKGTYFAVKASYSASDTYSKPSASGEKCMYLCRVLTGDFTLGNQSMIVPPSKGSVSIQHYDSVVDNVAKPSIFVIFHDSQACPEYLITFK